MRGYSANEVFQSSELTALERATAIIEKLPERDAAGRLLRCHEVARVVGTLLGIDVVDGKYEIGAEHSWCVITRPVGKYRWWCILDPYVMGRLPLVQLVAVVPLMPNRYTPGEARDDIRTEVVTALLEGF